MEENRNIDSTERDIFTKIKRYYLYNAEIFYIYIADIWSDSIKSIKRRQF